MLEHELPLRGNLLTSRFYSTMPYSQQAPRPDDSDGVNDAPKLLADRLSFLELDERDQARLRALTPCLEDYSVTFVEAFYRHLFAFENSARFLREPQVVERLKRAQQQHFLSLLQCEWDTAYVDQRKRVGQMHANVGIDPELFLGAYNQYLQHSFRHYLSGDGKPISPEIETLMSLLKVVFLDLGLTLEAYFLRATQNIQVALDMYWKANIELRQFAHLTSHDLKTPLATVANFCDEALDEFGDQMPSGAKELIASARDRTFRMSTMIDELLHATTSFDLARQLQEVSSQTAFGEALDRLRPAMQAKQITFNSPETMPIVWGDAIRLRESFYNVLANALKYVEAKTGRITTTIQSRDDEVEFIIADNGPGIPREELEQIFAPFHRSTAHRDRPGSGLGLYFTKTMLEYQGGKVWAESAPGDGSSFHIVLRKPPSD